LEERRLAAIMFTDMVGYSALTQSNEALAHELLEEHRQLLRDIFPKFGGNEIKTIGDGFHVEFASALKAVRCAIEIQQTLKAHNAIVPAERSIYIRIGIHEGDVMPHDQDVFGDTVNIASRIEPLAKPGGICISESVFVQVRNKLEDSPVSLGKQELKNIEVPIEVYRIVLPWEREVLREAPSPEKPRVAVLPLANISPDSGDEYFADGMTEELIYSLSKVRGLQVIAQTSVMRYKGTSKSVAEIGQELKVGTVLEGSVRKAGDKLRITVQLIDVLSEAHLWSQKYDRELEDVFAIQSDVAHRVAEELEIELVREDKAQLEQRPTQNLKAYTLYLKGRYFWNKRISEEMKKAIEYFEQAIEVDPKYALAYAGLADCYSLLPQAGLLSATEAFPKARAAALKALELDDSLAEAHASLALALDYAWAWEEAERAYRRAVELRPGYATAHHWYALYLMDMARFNEAFREMDQAHELDPLSLALNRDLGRLFYYARQYDSALEQLQSTVEMSPEFTYAHLYLGRVHLARSSYDEALAEFQREKELSGARDSAAEALTAYTYANMGRGEEALRALDALQADAEEGRVSPYLAGLIWLALGDGEEGFRWLQQAYEQRDFRLSRLQIDPLLDEAREDSRYADLLRKMGLEG